jgi:hypothetical protein
MQFSLVPFSFHSNARHDEFIKKSEKGPGGNALRRAPLLWCNASLGGACKLADA